MLNPTALAILAVIAVVGPLTLGAWMVARAFRAQAAHIAALATELSEAHRFLFSCAMTTEAAVRQRLGYEVGKGPFARQPDLRPYSPATSMPPAVQEAPAVKKMRGIKVSSGLGDGAPSGTVQEVAE